MVINFCHFSCHRKRVGKQNTTGFSNSVANSISGVKLVQGSTLLNPTLEFSVAAVSEEKWAQINMIHIPHYGRYYFIDNVTYQNNGLMRVELSVDVLTSFAADIKASSQMVKRYENPESNDKVWPLLMDTELPIGVNKKMVGVSVGNVISDSSSGSVVVMTSGANSGGGE